MNSFDNNKNEKQVYFNQVKGVIKELNNGDKFCSITLSVGHEMKREVNFVIKKEQFEWVSSNHKVGDKVAIKFYLTSRNKMGKWSTMATALDVQRLDHAITEE